jgi:hypothetical protein
MSKVIPILSVCCFVCGLGNVASPAADLNVVVVLDDSGSMDEWMQTTAGGARRIDAAKEALVAVLAKLPGDTNVGIVTLNSMVEGSNWVIPLGPLKATNWQNRVAQIEAQGGTPLGEYMKVGADQLLVARAKQYYGVSRLLVVTDGEANNPDLVQAYVPDILTRGIILDVIGVDMQSDHSLATRAHSYRRADDDRSLTQALTEVFAETTVDDQAGADSFELLAGLPDEFATQAIAALSQRNDEPIVGITTEGGYWGGVSGGPQGQSNNIGPGSGSSVLGSIIRGLLCCAGALLAVFVLIVALFSQRRTPGRRR